MSTHANDNSNSNSNNSKNRDIKVIFILNDEEKVCFGYEGQTLLELAHENGMENELIGSCDHSLACSTCHVILEDSDEVAGANGSIGSASSGESWYDKSVRLCEKSVREDDMLDLAFGVEKNSRLGCQIILNEELNGMIVRVPLV